MGAICMEEDSSPYAKFAPECGVGRPIEMLRGRGSVAAAPCGATAKESARGRAIGSSLSTVDGSDAAEQQIAATDAAAQVDSRGDEEEEEEGGTMVPSSAGLNKKQMHTEECRKYRDKISTKLKELLEVVPQGDRVHLKRKADLLDYTINMVRALQRRVDGMEREALRHKSAHHDAAMSTPEGVGPVRKAGRSWATLVARRAVRSGQIWYAGVELVEQMLHSAAAAAAGGWTRAAVWQILHGSGSTMLRHGLPMEPSRAVEAAVSTAVRSGQCVECGRLLCIPLLRKGTVEAVCVLGDEGDVEATRRVAGVLNEALEGEEVTAGKYPAPDAGSSWALPKSDVSMPDAADSESRREGTTMSTSEDDRKRKNSIDFLINE